MYNNYTFSSEICQTSEASKKIKLSFKNNKLFLRVVYDWSCNVEWQSIPCGSRWTNVSQ